MSRLASGGLIDRSHTLAFRFDGKSYGGYPGDTLASALLANGVRLVGRSFKYHRPRGIVTAGSEEPNALVELRTGARREPNTRATTIELYDGLEAQSQNRWPSLAFDAAAVNGLLAPFLPAGFYYKTFMWPAALWENLYEPLIRRAAGLGRASGAPDPDFYEKSHAFCDVLIVGAGPAGLMAALTAARSGVRVILCEDDFLLGGRLLSERLLIADEPGTLWARQAEDELRNLPNVSLMPRTQVFSAYDGNTFAALERVADHLPLPAPFQPRQRLWKIVARRAIIATGAVERPIAFAGNDRPGVMMASALRSYLNRYAATPGTRLCVFTAGDDGWRAAADAHAAGIEVVAIVDPRTDVPEPLREIAAKSGATLCLNARVTATRGGLHLRGVTLSSRISIACDVLAVSGGWNPALGLTSHFGARPRWSDAIAAFIPGDLPSHMSLAGAAGGTLSLSCVLAEGARAGAEAAAALGFAPETRSLPKTSDDLTTLSPLWHVTGGRGLAFVDFQNDVTTKDVALAAQEGFRGVEHLKRYTTLGMATDQGKMGAVVAQAIMAELTGRTIAETGTPIARPPVNPVAIGAFAGIHRGAQFRPMRLTASHDWAKAEGAVFTEAGPWLRAQYYPRPSEGDWLETVSREAKAVRDAVGVCDVSTLGKIDIQGADAGTFLDHVYINVFSNLAIGKARYGVMLREDGFIMDDGTTARLAPDHYLMTTTTVNAGLVAQHLEFCHQMHWPTLDVQMVSVTEHWAQYAIAGPRARNVLRVLVDPPFDLSNAAFPFLGASAVTVCGGLAARLFRISFSGELAYELAVPAHYGEVMMRAILAAGAPFGITPYGTEALSVLRIEKGHAAGNELNGQTTAADLGLQRMMSKKKDFIGRVLAGRPALTDPDRPALTGFMPVERKERLHGGAHFLKAGAAATPENVQGHMTSVAFSPVLGHWIGLGLLKRGPARLGEQIRAYDPIRGRDVPVEICSPIFIDPEGTRLHG